METAAEAQDLQLLEMYLESVTTFRNRLHGPGPALGPASIWRTFKEKLAWVGFDEPVGVTTALPPENAYESAPLLGLMAAIACFVREMVPPATWVPQAGPPAGQPPWAEGVACLARALTILAAPPAAERSRKTRSACRALMARLTALGASDKDLRGTAALVEAEMLFEGTLSEAAAQAYETACAQLADSRFIVLHALALQYAANACRRAGLPIADAGFRKEAALRYSAWGRSVQGRDLTVTGGSETLNATESAHDTSIHAPAKRGHFSRDLRAAIIAARALADEGASTRVAEHIIDTLRVLGGAGRVALVVESGDALVAEVDTAGTPDALPLRLLAYTMRSSDPVLLGDLTENTFDDPYFATHKTGSLLCVPWKQTSIGAGAVLLENAVTPNAFSKERIGIVRFLAITAATAAAHARLRMNMEAGIAQRIQSGNEAIEQAQAIRRSNSEMQMAGGFAHEMRNSLAATRFALSSLIRRNPEDTAGVLDDDAALIDRCRAQLEASDIAPSLPFVRGAMEGLQASQATLETAYDIVREGIDRGLHAAKVIMEFGRIAGDKSDLPPSPLEPLLNACISRWHDGTAAMDPGWDVFIPPGFTLPLSDKHVTTILQALIGNAVEACADAGAAQARITIAASRSSDGVSLRIADNGCGMSADTQRRAFEPFFSTKGSQNVGLGLTMARKIAHLYGGNVHLTSTAGQGATIEMRFDA